MESMEKNKARKERKSNEYYTIEKVYVGAGKYAYRKRYVPSYDEIEMGYCE